jgi:hypothetical protein
MAEETFRPPKYEETLHLLFEKETGKVVASERRWTLVGESSHAPRTSHSDVLLRVISGLGRREEEFDVLVLTGQEMSKAPVSRVDVRRREPIREESRREAEKRGVPPRIQGP